MATELDRELYKNDINRENLKSLLSDYKEDPEIFLAFLGAGISSSIKGVPDLEELYVSCCEKYGHPKDSTSALPQLFEDLYMHIEDKENFDSELFNAVIPKTTSATATHIEIARAFNCFVTTNYHDPIEDGFRQKQSIRGVEPKELIRHFFVVPNGDEAKNTLTYLHGNLLVGFCILRKKDYQFFYPSLHDRHGGVYVVENSLRKILTNWSVVFLGCSLEEHLKGFVRYLVDKDKRKILGKSEEIENKKVKFHYWITSKKEISKYLKDVDREKQKYFEEEYFNNYIEMGIKPIIYSGDHRFVELLCRTLAEILETRIRSSTIETYDPMGTQRSS